MALKKDVNGYSCSFLPIELDSDLVKGFGDHLLAICRGDWSRDRLKERLFEGLTNKLIAFYQEGEEEDEEAIVLVRLNGSNTDVFIDRERELTIMLWLHQNGLSPPVYCQLLNGLCYGFAPGRQIELREMHDPVMGKRVAVALARLHTLQPPPYLKQHMLDVFFDEYLNKIPKHFSRSETNKR